MNRLYYGDCLTVMQGMGSASVDLIYLDPPFNSQCNYNAIYKDETGRPLPDQVEAFCDMWELDEERERVIRHMPFLVREAGIADEVAEFWRLWMNALRGTNPRLLAYLSYMVERLLPMKRLLRPAGSIYLHCDPTASHYLKVMMDGIFGHENFRSEIAWRRTGSHGNPRRWGPIHDTILFYTQRDSYTWNWPKQPYTLGHVKANFIQDGEDYRTNYSGNVLTGSGLRGGESGKPWQGFDPSAKNRHWAIPRKLWADSGLDATGLSQHEKLDALLDAGLIRIDEESAWPVYERRIRADDGPATGDIWSYQPHTAGLLYGTPAGIDAEVAWMGPTAAERLGYATQKPVGLLTRIIKASSNPGDVVFDPFCGCATTLEAAHTLEREWIGVDIAIHAVKRVAAVRLRDRLKLVPGQDYAIEGVPRNLEGAQDLWSRDKYHFQKWAVEQVDGFVTTKRTADGGIDGRIYFEDPREPSLQSMVLEVKGGRNVTIADLRALHSVLEREEAQMAGFIIMHPLGVTKERNFRKLMAEAGDLVIPKHMRPYPRMQMLTVEDILAGETFKTPGARGRGDRQYDWLGS